jgi:branched-chain amino acid transport system ATP-binding protein
MVPEGRQLFSSSSVEENLSIGAYSKRAGPWNLEAIYVVFPMLKESAKSRQRRSPVGNNRWWLSVAP